MGLTDFAQGLSSMIKNKQVMIVLLLGSILFCASMILIFGAVAILF